MLSVHGRKPMCGIQRIHQEVRIDLVEQLLHFKINPLLFIFPDFPEQFPYILLHILKLTQQRIKFRDFCGFNVHLSLGMRHHSDFFMEQIQRLIDHSPEQPGQN
ncbi:hypothetical protein D3C87_1747850 [compost metagenome]